MDKEWFSGRAVGDDEARAERHELRKIIGILCIVGVLLGLFLGAGGCASAASQADVPVYVYEDEARTIRLMPTPCVDQGVKDFVGAAKPEYIARFKAIESMWRMLDGTRKAFAGCWIEFTAGEVGYEALGLLFEDGERYLVNKAKFLRKDEGT